MIGVYAHLKCAEKKTTAPQALLGFMVLHCMRCTYTRINKQTIIIDPCCPPLRLSGQTPLLLELSAAPLELGETPLSFLVVAVLRAAATTAAEAAAAVGAAAAEAPQASAETPAVREATATAAEALEASETAEAEAIEGSAEAAEAAAAAAEAAAATGAQCSRGSGVYIHLSLPNSNFFNFFSCFLRLGNFP